MPDSETGKIPDLESIAHRLAIQDVLFKHSRGVDRADAEILKGAYWPEAEVAYGAFNGNAHQFCEALAAGIRRYRLTHHQVSNISIDLNGRDALVESYVTAYHHRPADADTEMTYFGRYIDRMQQRDDVWKIIFRQVVMDWNQNLEETSDFSGATFEGLAKSSHKPDDPLYEAQNKFFGDSV